MEGLKLISASIKNFKNISEKIVQIDGRSLVIIGANARGKSSFIQAILSPLDSSFVPLKPIKEGEEKGSVKVKIAGEMNGEKREYLLEMYFTPSQEKGRLVVTNEKGEVLPSPKGLIKNIVGNISFDIFEFLRLKPKEQVNALKQIAGIDFTALDKKRQEHYDNRTFLNRRVSELESLLNNHGYSPEEVEKYSTKIDAAPLKSQITELDKKMQDYSHVVNGIEVKRASIEVMDEAVAAGKKKIEEWKRQIEETQKNIEGVEESKKKVIAEIAKGEEWLKDNPKPSLGDINQKLEEAEKHNRHSEQIDNFKKMNQELSRQKSESDKMTEDIKKVDEDKAMMMKNSKLPVPGLGFNDDMPLYNGLPLDENQINKSKLIEIGARIGMSLNPNLKVITIKDGSLLDKETLSGLLKIVEDNGYQLLIELVSFDGKELEVKFTEEIMA